MTRTVQRVPVPPDQLAGLPGAQYASAFQLRTTVSATPEQWARALFEQAPAVWRAALWVGWRYLLGLRLGPRRSAGHVQGWPIVSADATAITLATDSPLLSARDVFTVDGDAVTWVTLVRYDRRLARVLWGLAAPIHHLTVPLLFPRARP